MILELKVTAWNCPQINGWTYWFSQNVITALFTLIAKVLNLQMNFLKKCRKKSQKSNLVPNTWPFEEISGWGELIWEITGTYCMSTSHNNKKDVHLLVVLFPSFFSFYFLLNLINRMPMPKSTRLCNTRKEKILTNVIHSMIDDWHKDM